MEFEQLTHKQTMAAFNLLLAEYRMAFLTEEEASEIGEIFLYLQVDETVQAEIHYNTLTADQKEKAAGFITAALEA